MITKISILRSNLSWEDTPRLGALLSAKSMLNAATHEISRNAEFYNRSASLVSFLREYPDHDVEQAINLTFPPGSFTINPKTKTSRTYFINGGLYIHETDKA